jgi:hypothetical protein
MAATNGLVNAAEATRNPLALSYAFFVIGFAFGDADPDRAREALRRGLVIAQDSGNRANETHLAATLCRLEAARGRPTLKASVCRSERNTKRCSSMPPTPLRTWSSNLLAITRRGFHAWQNPFVGMLR